MGNNFKLQQVMKIGEKLARSSGFLDSTILFVFISPFSFLFNE